MASQARQGVASIPGAKRAGTSAGIQSVHVYLQGEPADGVLEEVAATGARAVAAGAGGALVRGPREVCITQSKGEWVEVEGQAAEKPTCAVRGAAQSDTAAGSRPRRTSAGAELWAVGSLVPPDPRVLPPLRCLGLVCEHRQGTEKHEEGGRTSHGVWLESLGGCRHQALPVSPLFPVTTANRSPLISTIHRVRCATTRGLPQLCGAQGPGGGGCRGGWMTVQAGCKVWIAIAGLASKPFCSDIAQPAASEAKHAGQGAAYHAILCLREQESAEIRIRSFAYVNQSIELQRAEARSHCLALVASCSPCTAQDAVVTKREQQCWRREAPGWPAGWVP